MDDAAQKMRQARDRLKLRFRDVTEASNVIAERQNNEEYRIVPSRLSAIENEGIVPSIYRLYSLCVIYRLDFQEALEWYGVKISGMPSDAAHIKHETTHMIGFPAEQTGDVTAPLSLNPGVDLRKTTFLSQVVQRWGTLPLATLQGFGPRQHRYAWIGTEDWYMYPILRPGALVMIDESRRRIQSEGWSTELERPIYLLEHRDGYICSWCSLASNQLILQPHPASACMPKVYAFPQEVEIIGQVTGWAMTLDDPRRDRTRS